MIAHLEGTVLYVAPTSVVLSVQGVGFSVSVTPAASAKARIGTKLALHTKLIVREDDLALFGFDAASDREAFELLTSVSGVGPKTAMAVLSTLGSDGLAAAVDSGDEKAFKPVPGIGPKLAKLIILQLSGKLIASATKAGASPDMVEALVGLGWQEAKAQQTLQKVLENQPELDGDSSGLLRAALRILGGTK
ncbi:MAG TPA: Holliday junction branch migration protein RuvA [Candidatus Agrococcus pullicola]|uniref:Holliday junction branch migration complex subunit RuvA n=1 Tax=Candidatus Agrococcus pullicola TaxID=2838429 RepID=A0A9D2C9I6_9MICO|nr:Holliday junction branch migration protein RuvA [Candidatus Agrococcus pullicola]